MKSRDEKYGLEWSNQLTAAFQEIAAQIGAEEGATTRRGARSGNTLPPGMQMVVRFDGVGEMVSVRSAAFQHWARISPRHADVRQALVDVSTKAVEVTLVTARGNISRRSAISGVYAEASVRSSLFLAFNQAEAALNRSGEDIHGHLPRPRYAQGR